MLDNLTHKGERLPDTYKIDSTAENLAQKSLFFLTAGNINGLSFNERLLYSALVKFLRQGRIARKRDLATYSGLGAINNSLKAITTALQSLIDKKLAIQTGRNYTALEPSADQLQWFVARTNRKAIQHWSDRFAYTVVPIVGNAVESVLLALVASYKGGYLTHTSHSGIAKMTGTHRKTIGRTIDKLISQGRLKATVTHKTRFGTASRIILELIDQPQAEPVIMKPEASMSEAKCEPAQTPIVTIEDTDDDETMIRTQLANFQIPARIIKECLQILWQFPLSEVFDIHQRNLSYALNGFKESKDAGKCEVDHCGYLYRDALKEAKGRMIADRERNARLLTADHKYYNLAECDK